ncbi:MAG: hypothetical protein L0271_16185 [Gemmatimonadetes bacterium]|nr:hypothetical protein [Gemmatimonadota bacterium]
MMSARLTAILAVSFGSVLIAIQAPAQTRTVRIIQTNAAGDNVHLIDPATHRVVDMIRGIPIAHGVTSHPDGTELYFSNEVERTLDIVSVQTLNVAKKIPLSGRPNNVAITPDGRKIYVAIRDPGAFVDVIDLQAGKVVKSIPTAGGVHNVYVTPDGAHVVAGMIAARTLTVIDARTDEPVWSMEFDGGVRPMAFENKPDGSTGRIFVQISDFHGFYVIDFAKREVVRKVTMPELPITRVDDDGLQGSPGHGLAVSPDGTQIWSTSKPTNHVYAWTLPDLEFIGGVAVGSHPDWLTMTPDGRYLYSANAGSNDVSVIDTKLMREVVRIPVGQVPKRNHTALLRLPRPAVAPTSLSFETYRQRVEPIFLRERAGHGPGLSPCAACHTHNSTPLKLEPLEEDANGRVFWSEAASRTNFDIVSRLVAPGDPEASRLLRKPLATPAGGAPFHVGGKFWASKDDPEWRTIADWVRAAAPAVNRAPDGTKLPDFEFFRTCVQRLFLSKREGHVECVHCHGSGERGFAQTLPPGRTFWNLEESRQNFDLLTRYVEPGFPLLSRFLTHPLSPEAGGDHMHAGGRRWGAQNDPEWQMLAAWVRGEAPRCVIE